MEGGATRAGWLAEQPMDVLIAHAQEHGISTTGCVDDLVQRIISHERLRQSQQPQQQASPSGPPAPPGQSQADLDEDERLARQLQAEEDASMPFQGGAAHPLLSALLSRLAEPGAGQGGGGHPSGGDAAAGAAAEAMSFLTGPRSASSTQPAGAAGLQQQRLALRPSGAGASSGRGAGGGGGGGGGPGALTSPSLEDLGPLLSLLLAGAGGQSPVGGRPPGLRNGMPLGARMPQSPQAGGGGGAVGTAGVHRPREDSREGLETLMQLFAAGIRPNQGVGEQTVNRRTGQMTYREPASPVAGSPGGGDEEERKCMVCLELFEVGQDLRILPCLHRYHVTCIDPWLATNRHCPVCKHDITSG
mmetsp:Transcript_168792/g.542490  ORF Transcript_168792/g.542490 Transcript_168792/m.542490 type:complete len:360 (-) Transcript_168792:143-1222(-)